MILTIAFPLQCLCALALSFLYHPIEISADICLSSSTPKNGDTSSTRLDKPAKQCPDFKDPEDQIACCPSQISNSEFFCCTRGKKSELEAALAAEARKKFISSHIPELIICFLAVLVLSFLICSCLCRHSSFCPLLHRRRKAHQEDRHGSASLSLQSNNSICRSSIGRFHHPRHQLHRTPHQQFVRQQQTDLPLFHKEYDAPPPYSFTPCPPPPLAIAPLNCLMNEEEQQNRLNAQREELDETEQK